MEAINFDNIKNLSSRWQNSISIMYGAGGNGERILKIFNEYSIKINYFCDDDYNKWGTHFHHIPVISFEKVEELSKKNKVNIVLTSVFAGAILTKLDCIEVSIYEPFSMLIDKYYNHSFYKVCLPEDQKIIFEKNLNLIAENMKDEESKKILAKILEVVKSPNNMDYSHFFDVASKEDCYFIKEVLEALPEHPVIVDCGGFTGDLMVALDKHKIDYDKVYSFEVNQELFRIMQKNIKKNSLEDRFIPINKGVWNTCGKAHLHVQSDDIAGGNIIEESDGVIIDTITIDTYFSTKKFDFIKMDIEGAELRAIQGGISLIEQYRPIMAISLYHSVNDVIEIPFYLCKKLTDYNYFIRHHSFIDSETVLYCIPCEKLK